MDYNFHLDLIDKVHVRAHASCDVLFDLEKVSDKVKDAEEDFILKITSNQYKAIREEVKQHRKIIKKHIYWYFLWLIPIRRKSTFPKTLTPMQYIRSYHPELLCAESPAPPSRTGAKTEAPGEGPAEKTAPSSKDAGEKSPAEKIKEVEPSFGGETDEKK